MARQKRVAADTGANGPTAGQTQEYARRLAEAKRSLRETMDEAAGKRGVIAGIKTSIKKAGIVGVDYEGFVRVVDDMILDQEEVRAAERAYIRMRAVLNMPMTQQDLFPAGAPVAATEPEHEVWQVKQAGYMAGVNGHDMDKACPHLPGSEEYVAWVEGWHDGQAHLAGGLKGKREARTTRKRAA